MQKANDVVIESEPKVFGSLKSFALIISSIIVLSAAGYYLYGLYRSKTSDCALRTKGVNPVSSCISFERADTPEGRRQGLSGRDNLPNNKAMLFVFDSPGKQCMWMKGMKFDLDIVWLDANKRITKVLRNVSPKTYPENFCGSDHDLYVVELAVGAVGEDQLKVGNQLNI